MALKQKIILLVFILVICASHVLASESSSFQINDESLNFGYNAGFLESTTYAMDLGGITWVDRNSESGSYKLIDGNSIIDGDPFVPPTPPPSGGSTGGGGGSALQIPDYEDDSPIIAQADIPEERPLKELPEEEEEELHEAPEEPEVSEEVDFPEEPEVPEVIEEPLPVVEEEPTFIFTEEEGFLYYETEDGLDDYDFVTDLDYEVAPLKIEIPTEDKLESEDGEVTIDGNTGENYEITAIWIGEDYVSKSFATANEDGDFIVRTPGKLNDGEYLVLLYGLEKEGNKIIQTKYSTVNFEVVDGKAYVKEITGEVKITCVRWDFIVIYAIIILITCYLIWRKLKK